MDGSSSCCRLVGLAGPSCSGKTTIGRAVGALIGTGVSTLPADVYYRDQGHIPLEERALVNFDHPSSMEEELLVEHLVLLKKGKSISRPVYDFRTHTRTDELVTIDPTPIIIVEGLFVLQWERVRALMDLRLYVDAPDTVCLPRRIRRDVAERNRSEASVIEQYTRVVRPMAEQFVRPSAAYADLVLSGSDAVDRSVARIRTALDFG